MSEQSPDPVTEPVPLAAEPAGAPPVPPPPVMPVVAQPSPVPPQLPAAAPPVYDWQQPAEEIGPAPGVRFAGYGARLIAYIVDGILIGAATIVAAIVLGIVIVGFARSGSDTAAGVSGLLLAAVVLVISLGYFPYFWARNGQTPGMRMVRIRVVRDRDGGPVSGGQAILRFIGYAINSAVFYIGWIWIFVDGRRRGWHDLIAGTVVIEA